MTKRILVVEDQEDLRGMLARPPHRHGLRRHRSRKWRGWSRQSMKGDEEKARAAGCDRYVTKPYSPMQLLRVIKLYLETK